MTLQSVQDRAAEIAARLAALAPRAAYAPGAAGAFRAELATASAAVSPAAAPASAGLGQRVVDLARSHVGKPYEWGAEGPDTFDCSGLVQSVYAEVGVELPRVSRDQARAGVAVSPAEARAGDLVFFGSPVDHVGIYAGDGTMVVAPRTGENVRVQRVDLARASTIRRVLPEPAAPVAGGAWADALPPAGKPYAAAIDAAARRAGLDPRVVAAVAWSESGFAAGARSGAGATGLMQLMPATAASLGVDPTDPVQSLAGGARYLRAQLDRFGRLDLALAAYNAGPGAVTRHGGIPPYDETRTYVRRVLERIDSLGGTP